MQSRSLLFDTNCYDNSLQIDVTNVVSHSIFVFLIYHFLKKRGHVKLKVNVDLETEKEKFEYFSKKQKKTPLKLI